jgi:hypothetical protein
VKASPIRLPAALLLAVSLGVVVRRLGVDWRWLALAVLLVPELGVASGLLLCGARRRVTGWLAVGGGGHTVPSVGASARSSTASRLVATTDISLRSRPVRRCLGWIDAHVTRPATLACACSLHPDGFSKSCHPRALVNGCSRSWKVPGGHWRAAAKRGRRWCFRRREGRIAWSDRVVRDRIELSTFRFSEGR